MYTDDPVRDFERWDAEQADRLAERPRCSQCDEYIQEDYAYNINGELICQECIETFLVSI